MVAPHSPDILQTAYQISAPDAECVSSTLDDQKQSVHIFFIHGLDPFDAANLKSVREFCHGHGFWQTTLAQFYHFSEVTHRILQVKACNPAARIVIFGFSAGTLTTRKVVSTLHRKHGIDVDTVIYASGITLTDNAYSRPDYVGKIIHIRDGGLILPGFQLSGAENYKFMDIWHFGSPTHSQTLEILLRELYSLTWSNPILVEPGSNMHQVSKAPVQTAPPTGWEAVQAAPQLVPPPRFVVK